MKPFNSSNSDEDLMRRFIDIKDRKAFDLVYGRHFNSLCKYLGWLSHDPDSAADIVQNIFLKLYEKPSVFDPSRNFKVWLFSSAKNQWKNELRNRSTRSHHLQHLAPTANVDGKEMSDDRQERLSSVLRAVEKLNETHKEVFVLKYSNNLSIQEISEVCNLPLGTVKSRLFNALQQLKNQLNPIKDLQP